MGLVKNILESGMFFNMEWVHSKITYMLVGLQLTSIFSSVKMDNREFYDIEHLQIYHCFTIKTTKRKLQFDHQLETATAVLLTGQPYSCCN
jgi:hypothetical protein